MRSIDADVLKKWIDESICQYGNRYSNDMLNMFGLFAEVIDKAPTIENPCESCEDKAVEYSLGFQDGFLTGRDSVKKTGTWSRKIFPEEKWTRERFYCSVCNGWNTYGKSKFCPNCGAEMKGGAK